jgi:hypothetical protein
VTKSVRSVYIVVRLDFVGDDVGRTSIDEALSEMEYSFIYKNDYLRIVNSEIVEVLPNKKIIDYNQN